MSGWSLYELFRLVPKHVVTATDMDRTFTFYVLEHVKFDSSDGRVKYYQFIDSPEFKNGLYYYDLQDALNAQEEYNMANFIALGKHANNMYYHEVV